ncbi:type 4 fimbrial biogenesis protein PilZ [Chitiniphilus shinanonensis]|uniref:Type 4 fimbrial biogenesis protein PilZ n=1 Tax=Chitiniphilus shinanonensis TaxID=553088 RepID=A0ABQ6BVL5_9NEIS|nr:PilZ domain-containing protein [Chitiniphilus shinanonensis]GLS05699.1 type 4 fimbrial biogenesis protein PilZ [Chitiniphilus shinanonensis]
MEAPKQASRPGVLSLNIKEKAALYASYMPFVTGGGIFIPTSKPYRLGDEVFMLLSLLDDPAKIAVSGHVVWVTPQGAHNNHQQGIGVRFSSNEAGAQARNKIEALLGGYLQSSRTTHTM